MKTTKLALACLATMALVVGCGPPSQTPSTETRSATAQPYAQVQQEARETTHSMNDYAYAQKADYVTTRQAELAAINRDLDRLAGRIENATYEAKTEATPKLQALRDQVAKMNMHLDEAKNATESTWDDVKAKSNRSYRDFKDGFDQMRDWMSEKIAP